MSPEDLHRLLGRVPVFVLVLCRVGGVMAFAPLFGSARIPKRVRALLALVMSLTLAGSIGSPRHLPATTIETALAMAGELAFGIAMGTVLSYVFIAAQWAGQLIGQQIGFNIAETFDPEFGQGSTVVGDMYFMLALVVFLSVGGHRQIVAGLRDSFDTMPLLTPGVDRSTLDLLIQGLVTATELAARLAAPVLISIMAVDLALGFLGKTIPQLNVMAAGMSIKSLVGLAVLAMGMLLYTTPSALRNAIGDSVDTVRLIWAGRG